MNEHPEYQLNQWFAAANAVSAEPTLPASTGVTAPSVEEAADQEKQQPSSLEFPSESSPS